ncbi:hypothetical protein MBLNU459_g2288t1 [Dothideomycetes sp. NU459]
MSLKIAAFVGLTALASLSNAATFNWDCTNSLGTCQNYCFTARCRGASEQLTYDANKTHRDPRRTLSGCNRTPCSNDDLSYAAFGNSCDEFPFASVTQGGSGARLRCVDGSENSSEGGQLGNFYKTIADGTDFSITIENYGGASYCEPDDDDLDCTNDGGEFFLDPDGNFVDGKRSLSARGFTIDVGNVKPTPLRKLQTTNGTVLVIAESKSNPIRPGEELWSNYKAENPTVIGQIN